HLQTGCGEAASQLADLAAHAGVDRGVGRRLGDGVHPRGDLAHLRLLHAAAGDRRRAEADARRIERLARVERHGVVVALEAGGVVTTSATGTGDGWTPAATRPAMWAMSATRSAPVSRAISANSAKSMIRGIAVPPAQISLGRSRRARSRTSSRSMRPVSLRTP